jgi:hypothetical protein
MVTDQVLVYDKGFVVWLDIDVDSDKGLGTTERVKSQLKKNCIEDTSH